MRLANIPLMLQKINLYQKILTIFKLGPRSILTLLIYKLKLKIFLNPVANKTIQTELNDFFYDNSTPLKKDYQTANLWLNNISMYGYNLKGTNTSNPPLWHKDYLLNEYYNYQEYYWNKISLNKIKDLKNIWELSRFDWSIYFAQRIALGNKKDLSKLNEWIKDWHENNQPYKGINWICAQESSIRLLNLISTSIILNNHKKIKHDLNHLLKINLDKIYHTIEYGIAQNNNHGLIEAIALLSGGIVLKHNNSNGAKYIVKGRKVIKDRVKKLIFEDGGFCQYSMNYHRLMLDGLSIGEIITKKFDENGFDKETNKKIQDAILFIYNFTQEKNGVCPNIGNNDGAKLIPLDSSPYNDFRPSIQLAAHLFHGYSLFENNKYNNAKSLWMRIKINEFRFSKKVSKLYKNSGLAILRNNNFKIYFKYPSFDFRPSQADSLHLDLNVKNNNILCDAGSYSYNENIEKNHFRGAKGHNIPEFDDKDHMRKFSNFLYMDWLNPENLFYNFKEENLQKIECSIKDYRSIKHRRKIELSNHKVIITDVFNERFINGILRFRLNNINNAKWNFYHKKVENKYATLSFNKNIVKKHGWKSESYMKKEKIDVVEIDINPNDKIVTTITF